MEILVVAVQAELYATELRKAAPAGTVVHAATSLAEALPLCAGAEVLVAYANDVPAELVEAMPRLRWVQALTTGTDSLAHAGLAPDVIVTSGRGIHGPQMAELAFLLMMTLTRDFGRVLRNQVDARWERWPQRLLLGKTAVLVGLGVIGEAIALRCKAFGMHVVGVSAGRTEAPGVDEVVPRGSLTDVAARADFLIILVPLMPDTERMIGSAVISALPRHAILINLARGGVLDDVALADALTAGRIAGAGLDVFDVEPLPQDSPLWHVPNVVITPHIGGMSDTYAKQVLPIVIENVSAFHEGRFADMTNVVSRAQAGL